MAIRTLLGGVAITILACSMAPAITIQTIPSGLPAGSEYRLVGVTTSYYDGNTNDINEWDTRINNEIDSIPALDVLGVTWKAMVSVTTGSNNEGTKIKNHLVVTGDSNVPIYDLNSNLVAPNRSCLFTSGSCHPSSPELGPIGYSFSGEDLTGAGQALVWTGSHPNGNIAFNRGLGDPTSNMQAVGFTGAPYGSNSQWLTTFGYYTSAYLYIDEDNDTRVYGISDILTVPEPSTLILSLIGLALLPLWRRR